MYFITQTYTVNEGQVSKACFNPEALDVAPRGSTWASSAGPVQRMSGTTMLGSPAPVLPAAAQVGGQQGTPAGIADSGAHGMEKPIKP